MNTQIILKSLEGARPVETNKPVHILLINNNVRSRQQISRILSRAYKVKAVSDGRKALAVILKTLPDLVLVDVILPEPDGFDLLQTLRSDPRTSQLPVILLSNHSDKVAIGSDESLKCTTPQSKALTAQDLLAKITSHLEHLRFNIPEKKSSTESAASNQNLLSLLPAAVYTCDAKGRITFFNRRAAELWGYEPKLNDDAVTFCACFKVWLPDGTTFVPPEQTPMAISLKTGQAFSNVEAIVEKPDRTRFHAVVNIDPILDKNGNVTGAVNVFQDITNLKKTENKLRESEARLQAVLASVNDHLVSYDRQWRYTFVNDEALKILGKSREELLGACVWEVFPNAVGNQYYQEVHQALDEQKIIRSEHYYQPFARWFENHIYPSADGVTVFSSDITWRKTVEKAFKESEERYRRLLQSLPAAVYTCDAHGRLQLYNPAAAELWGGKPAVGTEWCGSYRIYKADGSPLPLDQCPMAVTLREGKSVRGEEMIIERPDGSRRHVLPHPEPIRDATGKIVGAINMVIDITERKRAEEALRETQQRFVRFMQHLPGLAWIKDVKGRYVFVNEAAERAFGKSKEELYGRIDGEIFPDDVAEQFRRNDFKALASGMGIKTIETLAHDDGIHHSVVSKFPIYGPDNTPLLIGGIAIDITARIKAEEALHESEERLRLAIDAGRVGTWDWNIKTKVVKWSEQIYEFHGLKPGEFNETVEAFADLIHPQDRSQVEAAIQNSLKTFTPYSVEMRIVRPTGEIRWISTNGRVVADADGKPSRMLGATVDITEIRQAQETLLEQKRSLEIINAIGKNLSAELDLQKLVQSITDAGREVSGAEIGAFFYTVEDDKGGSYQLYTLSGAPKEDFENFGMPRNTHLFSSTFRGEGASIRVGDILKDPRYGKAAPHYGMPSGHFPVRSYLALPVIARSGKVIGGLFFGHSQPDIFTEESERILRAIASQAAVAIDNANLYDAVQRELNAHKQMENQLFKSNRELEQFAYIASHDLQEPLHMINSFVDLLAMRCEQKLEEKEKEYLEFIKQGSMQAKALIRELLEYSRIGKGKSDQIVQLENVIKEVKSNLKYSIEKSGAKITLGYLPSVTAEHLEMIQLFQNLVSNAIKYRSERPPEIQISSSRPEKSQWLFSVKDNGIGIDPQYQERIFGMFQRLHTKSEYSGTGIGLAICKKIVENHGGRIWVESEPHKGSTFYFTLNAS